MRWKRFPEICSFDGMTPIICCDSCNLVTNITDAVFLPTGEMVWKTGNKRRDKCLEYSKFAEGRCRRLAGIENEWLPTENCTAVVHYQKLASGGRSAGRNEFPHMALLGYGEEWESAQWLCGGSVISERYILTAAHCTQPSEKLGQVTFAALGILKRSDPPSLWQTYRVLSIINHPDYRPPSKYNDIALLQTETQIQFSRAVFPACLTEMEDEKYRLSKITATGWGALGHHREQADTLQVIKVQQFDDDTCSQQYPVHRHLERGYDNTTQMCYGDRRNPVDTCGGDSGGPLQLDSRKLCMYVILGVTSYGRACGFAGQAGMYTRVHTYLPWIEGVVWP